MPFALMILLQGGAAVPVMLVFFLFFIGIVLLIIAAKTIKIVPQATVMPCSLAASTPMPAVTFRNSTAHRSRNCFVRHASSTGTCRGAIPLAAVAPLPRSTAVVCPSGAAPGPGTRIRNTPIIMKRK